MFGKSSRSARVAEDLRRRREYIPQVLEELASGDPLRDGRGEAIEFGLPRRDGGRVLDEHAPMYGALCCHNEHSTDAARHIEVGVADCMKAAVRTRRLTGIECTDGMKARRATIGDTECVRLDEVAQLSARKAKVDRDVVGPRARRRDGYF